MHTHVISALLNVRMCATDLTTNLGPEAELPNLPLVPAVFVCVSSHVYALLCCVVLREQEREEEPTLLAAPRTLSVSTLL